METQGEKIKRIRKSKGISQVIVAESCMIKQSSYANIESGKTQSITIEVGIGIAKALGVSFNELFEIEVGNLPTEEGLIQIEDLKGKLEELKERLSEKDQLIKAITSQNKQLKTELLSSISFHQLNEIDNLKEKLEITSDEKKRQLLSKKISELIEFLHYDLRCLISNGALEQIDIDDFMEVNIDLSLASGKYTQDHPFFRLPKSR